ncbi:MAG: hypothetical protein KF693_16675 [Nitrospira sp.]|nr:hypothetical protein [Nitrospira sp.]
MKKELYVQPAVVKHELLRDITAKRSGHPGKGYGRNGNNGWGNGGGDGVPGKSKFSDIGR